MNDRVSILIPVYNAEKHLRETIQSALNQTWNNIEIIVVDDGSTDDSYEIAKSFLSKGVKVFKQENKGGCAARNVAFTKSTGNFIQYLDSDDLLAPDKIEKQLRLICNAGERASAICSFGKFDDSSDKAIFQNYYIYKDYSEPFLFLVDMWTSRSMLVPIVWLVPRRIIELAGPWNESLLINQDGEFFCRVAMNSNCIRFAKDAIAYYRVGNTNSVSRASMSPERVESLQKSYLLYEESLRDKLHHEEVKSALAINYMAFIYRFYGKYPSLIKPLQEKLHFWGIKPNKSIGGKYFNSISKLLGFYNALKIRKIFSHD